MMEAKRLYDEGKMNEVIKIIAEVSPEKRTIEMRRMLAWALFHLKMYGPSLEEASKLHQEGDDKIIELIKQIMKNISEEDFAS